MNRLASSTLPAPLAHPIERIPHAHLADWAEESEAGRAYVLRWIAALDPLRSARGRTALFAAVAQAMHSTPGTVRNKYYAYLDGLAGRVVPAWETLIDRARFPHPGEHALPAAFLQHWKALVEQHQRADSGKAAHRVLLTRLDRWAKGLADAEPIPGYDEPPALESFCSQCNRKVPRGWSYRNLMNHLPSKFARALMRQGPRKASEHLPGNHTTRVGLRFLERIFFDDQVYDQKVVVPGLNQGRPFRPLGFNCLDHLTAAFLDYQVKLTRWDDDAEVGRVLTGEDFAWTVVSLLQKVGYRDDERGTTLIFEHGTASGYKRFSRDDDRSFDQILYHLSGGRLTVDRSGRFDQPFLTQALFRGRGKQAAGNPRFKAPLESVFHLVRTHSAGLLGQVGQMQRLNGPESDAVLDSYTRHTLAAIDALPVAQRHRAWDLVRLPFHTLREWTELMRLVYGAIMGRIDHRLEGWADCGFSVEELRLPDGHTMSRQTYLALPAEHQLAIRGISEPVSRVMSPAEAVEHCVAQDRGQIARFSDCLVPSLIPPHLAREVTVGKNHEIRITDARQFGPEALIYPAEISGRHGVTVLRAGTSYFAYLNPFAPDRLILTDRERRFLGTCERFIRPVAGDRGAILANQGRLNAMKARIAAPIERRHATARQQLADDAAWNRRLLAGEPMTDDEVADARARGIAIDPGRLTPADLDALEGLGDPVDSDTAEGHFSPDPVAGYEAAADLDPDQLAAIDEMFRHDPEIDGLRDEF